MTRRARLMLLACFACFAVFAVMRVARADVAWCNPAEGCGSGKECPEVVGDPVHVGWGTMSHWTPLGRIDGGGGLVHELQLLYSSLGYTLRPQGALGYATYSPGQMLLSLEVMARDSSSNGAGYLVVLSPTGRLYPFSPVIDGCEYRAIDPMNHTRLRNPCSNGVPTDTSRLEWIEEDGKQWTLRNFGDDGFYYSEEIRAPSRELKHNIYIDRNPTTAQRHEILSVALDSFAQEYVFDYDANELLSSIDVCAGPCSSNAHERVTSIYYDSNDGVTDVAFGNGSTSGVTSHHYVWSDDGWGVTRLASVEEHEYTGGTLRQRTLGAWTYAEDGKAETATDAEGSYRFWYDTNTNVTYVGDLELTSGTATNRVAYEWAELDVNRRRKIGRVYQETSSSPKCVHCDRPVEFKYDIVGNRAAARALNGVWTTSRYDNDVLLTSNSTMSGNFVTSIEGSIYLEDASANFSSINVGDIVQLEHNGLRVCANAAPAFGYCQEPVVLAKIGNTTLEISLEADPGVVLAYKIFRTPLTDLITAGTDATVSERTLINAPRANFLGAGVAAGDAVRVLDEINECFTCSPQLTVGSIIGPNWIEVVGAFTVPSVSLHVEIWRGQTKVTEGYVVDRGSFFVLETSESLGTTSSQDDATLSTGTTDKTVAIVDRANDKHAILSYEPGLTNINTYEIRRNDNAHRRLHGANVLWTIENDQRFTGSTCIPDDDPTTLPPSSCVAARVTTYTYDSLGLSTLRTSETRDSGTSGGRKHVTVWDYDVAPIVTATQLASPDACTTYGPSSFNTEEHTDFRPRRIITLGWKQDGLSAPLCEVRVTHLNYGAPAAGRPVELLSVDGPVASDDVDYDYWNSAGSSVDEKRRLGRLRSTVRAGALGPLTLEVEKYDPLGLPLHIRDENSQLWALTRDSRGRVTSRTTPLNETTTIAWGPYEHPRYVQKPLGNRVGMTFDTFGRPTQLLRLPSGEDPESPATVFSKLVANRYVHGTPCDVESWERSSIEGGATALRLVHGWTSERDEHGNVKSLTTSRDDAGTEISRTLHRTWTPDGFLLGEQWESGTGGPSVDPATVRKLTYDAESRLLSEERKIDSTLSKTAELAYDRLGNTTGIKRHLTSLISSDDNWLYADQRGPRQGESPEMGTTKYTHDKAGRLTELLTPENVTIGYARDGRGRLTQRSFPTDPSETYDWDAPASPQSITDCITGTLVASGDRYLNGRLRSVTETNKHTLHYGYDADGRIVFEARQLSGASCATFAGRAYDANSNVTLMTYPVKRPLPAMQQAEPRRIRYVYGAGGDANAVSKVELVDMSSPPTVLATLVDEVQIGAVTQELNYRLAGLLWYRLALNKDGSPQRLSVRKNGETERLIDRRFRHDTRGRTTAIEDMITAYRTQRYAYDDLDRLTGWRTTTFPVGDTDLQTYIQAAVSLDRQGNRLSIVRGPSSMASTNNYTYVSTAPSRMDSETNEWGVMVTQYGYSNSGRVLTVGSMGFTDANLVYDDAGRFVGVDGHGFVNPDYTFVRDYQNRRWKRTLERSVLVPEDTYDFTFTPDGLVLSEASTRYCLPDCSSPPTWRKDYVWLAGRPVAMLVSYWPDTGDPEEKETSYIVANHLGAPLRAYAEDGTVHRLFEADPWGRRSPYNFSEFVTTESAPDVAATVSEVSPYSALSSGTQTSTVYTSPILQGESFVLYFKDFNLCDDTLEIRDANTNVLIESYSETDPPMSCEWAWQQNGYGPCSFQEFLSPVNPARRIRIDITKTDGTTNCSQRDGFKLTAIGINFDSQQVWESPWEVPIGLPGQYADFLGNMAFEHLWENWHRTYDSERGRYLQPEPVLRGPAFPLGYVASGVGVGQYTYAAGNPLLYVDPNGRTIRRGHESLNTGRSEETGLLSEDETGDDQNYSNSDASLSTPVQAPRSSGGACAPAGPSGGGCNKVQCMNQCSLGVAPGQAFCSSIPHPAMRAGCYAAAAAGEVACQGWCMWNCD